MFKLLISEFDCNHQADLGDDDDGESGAGDPAVLVPALGSHGSHRGAARQGERTSEDGSTRGTWGASVRGVTDGRS